MKQRTNDPEKIPRKPAAAKSAGVRGTNPRPEADDGQLLALERSAREQAEAAVRAKDEFIAVVTHELRSPLNAIRGWAHVLRHSGPLHPTQLHALDAIDRNTQAQVRLVDDLLDSQRILCGRLELSPARVPIQTIVDEAIEVVMPAAQHKRIRMENSRDARGCIVRVDPERLRQALVKLLANAVKFTPEDGIVSTRASLQAGALAIEVSDTGVGLDAGQLPALFAGFNQADSSSKRRTGGLGLGLSLARQLVELHGGVIKVDSRGAGLGTTFTIELPLGVVAEPDGDAGGGVAASPLSGKRVLVVEDDDDGREALGLILRDAEVELHSFDRADKAYEYLAHVDSSELPDVLISDIAMPDEDGYEFIRRVRRLEGEEHRRHLVALALTSFSRVEDRVRALKAGFDMHVAKPIDPDLILRTLAEVIERGDDAPVPQL